jgi:hypothetical protein
MDVSFDSAALAALCSSERQMADAWGDATGRLVGRWLLDLRAVSVDALARLPAAAIETDDSGQTTITFGDVIVCGRITDAHGAADADQLLIQSIDIEKSQSR